MGSSGQFTWKLADHPKLPKEKIIAMVVLDGWGEANPDEYNCIHVAETPTMDSFKKVFFYCGSQFNERFIDDSFLKFGFICLFSIRGFLNL